MRFFAAITLILFCTNSAATTISSTNALVYDFAAPGGSGFYFNYSIGPDGIDPGQSIVVEWHDDYGGNGSLLGSVILPPVYSQLYFKGSNDGNGSLLAYTTGGTADFNLYNFGRISCGGGGICLEVAETLYGEVSTKSLAAVPIPATLLLYLSALLVLIASQRHRDAWKRLEIV